MFWFFLNCRYLVLDYKPEISKEFLSEATKSKLEESESLKSKIHNARKERMVM